MTMRHGAGSDAMKISDLSIRRPVFATVMSLAIVLFGVIAFLRLPVREYPDIDPPMISVVTLYRGASASVVETEITDILEEQFATLSGVKTMTSSSREEGSVITIEFELRPQRRRGGQRRARARLAQPRHAAARNRRAGGLQGGRQRAADCLAGALPATAHDGLELTDVADRVLKERIQRLPGVGSVILGGERRYAMRVWLDPPRLAARGV